METGLLKSKTYLYATAFFSGMAVMAVEIGASRLLAPYFSASQIVWTIIIGVIMIALALGNIWGGRLVGRLVDRWGYRNVMIWDTVVLFFVCLFYGFAKDWFSLPVATAVVCANYVLDAVLSNASMATNLYARTLSDSQEELTATLTSGISVNHVVTVFFALVGGLVFDRFGAGVLFSFAALMALANSAFALTVPRPRAQG